jgi:hypothetical protein
MTTPPPVRTPARMITPAHMITAFRKWISTGKGGRP